MHISVGRSPVVRLRGELVPLGTDNVLPSDSEAMAGQLMNEEQWARFLANGELDFSYSLAGVSRFRINAFRQRNCISIAARIVPSSIPTLEQIQAPPIFQTLAHKKQGLLLVTGPTGSGKSTTLAAIIHFMNQTMHRHIITLEDPIEFLHTHGTCTIDQREVGLDTKTFASGLRAALRQDPDVILVGEMRDSETTSIAITAAETGHLVLATLHTPGAPQSIDRIVDVFPGDQQAQIRVQLSSILLAIVSQQLLARADGSGRIAVLEILLNNPAIANLIRTDKTHQIRSVMQTSRAAGMQTMELHLKELFAQRQIRESDLKQLVEHVSI
ncbi:MAG: pilT [Bacilli bacterium]|nr:pilT [Bacilli bacterium]